MTQDDVIRLAREAGFDEQFTRPQDAIVRKGFALSVEFKGYKVNNAALEAFAKLVAEHEREACAKVAKAISDKYGWGHYGNEVDVADEIEAAIRARGQA